MIHELSFRYFHILYPVILLHFFNYISDDNGASLLILKIASAYCLLIMFAGTHPTIKQRVFATILLLILESVYISLYANKQNGKMVEIIQKEAIRRVTSYNYNFPTEISCKLCLVKIFWARFKPK